VLGVYSADLLAGVIGTEEYVLLAFEGVCGMIEDEGIGIGGIENGLE